MIRVLPAIVELGLAIYCVIDCIQSSDAEVRNLPRWAWIILIIIVPLIGGIAWLFVGRPLRTPGGPSKSWIGGRGGPQGGGGPQRRGPVGPDDDTEFLDGLRKGQTPPPTDDETPPAAH